MKIEDGKNEKGGVISEDEGKSLDTTRESSGLGNRNVVEDEDELPSRINSLFNDKLFRLQGIRQRLLVRRCLRFRCTFVILNNRNLSPSPEPVLQHRLAPLIVTNRTPSPLPSVGETFPSNQVPALSASAPEQQGVIAVRTSSPRLLAFVRDQGVFQDLIR